jgi:hypothetical protein
VFKLLKTMLIMAVMVAAFASAAVAQEVVRDQDATVNSPTAQIGVNNYMTQAQTITTQTGGVLHHATFDLRRNAANPEPLCVDLWSAADDTPVQLQQQLGCVNAPEMESTFTLVDINFQVNPYLKPGSQYALVLRSNAPEDGAYSVRYSQNESTCSENLYSGGTAFSGLYAGYPVVEWNRAGCADYIFATYNTIDTTAPTGTVQINNGAAKTDTRLVTLNLTASDPEPSSGGLQMRFKNADVYGSTFSAWEPYATSKSWQLSAGEGGKKVVVQYRDAANNRSIASDYIIFKR